MTHLVHQFWHNGSPPRAIRSFMKRWQIGTNYVLWTLDDVKSTLTRTQPLLDLASEIWGVNHRAVSDIARIAILHEFGGVYVDGDCEKVGMVWGTLEERGRDAHLVTVRPARPVALHHPRCCNGLLYAPCCRSPLLLDLLKAMHARLDMVASQKRMTDKTIRPVDSTGPMLIWFFQQLHDLPMIDEPWAAFAGMEKSDTEIVIHQNWRKYRG